MVHHMKITMKPERGALLRLLTLATKRGFEPAEMHAVTTPTGSSLDLSLEGKESIRSLISEIENLYSVETVELAG